MDTIKIGETDIFLQELGPKQGKIIIAHPYYNFSHYWGSMGGSLKEFLLGINESYFVNKLEPYPCNKPLDVKRTFAAFRKNLYEESDFSYYYPWKEMEFQKHLREEIRDIQNWADNQYDFVAEISSLPNRLDYYIINDRFDKKEMEECIRNACSEPWHYIVEGESREAIFLKKLFPKLKKEIKKILKQQNKTTHAA